MTESEARKRWCPFTRYAHRNAPTGGNRLMNSAGTDDITKASCIASDCMAWRWLPIEEQKHIKAIESNKPPPARRGYCGLAGKV